MDQEPTQNTELTTAKLLKAIASEKKSIKNEVFSYICANVATAETATALNGMEMIVGWNWPSAGITAFPTNNGMMVYSDSVHVTTLDKSMRDKVYYEIRQHSLRTTIAKAANTIQFLKSHVLPKNENVIDLSDHHE